MDDDCKNDRQWYIFIKVDLVIYSIGLSLILLGRLIKKVCCHSNPQKINQKTQRNGNGGKEDFPCSVATRLSIGELLSTQYLIGKLILLLTTVVAILSTGLYIYEVTVITQDLERCEPLQNRVFCVDLGCNIIFLVHFLLRFTAANDKLAFWFNIFTIIDFLTIPQAITSTYLAREWFGLRFLRIISIVKIPIVLQSFNLLKSGTSIRILSLLTLFLSIWIGGAGFFHLLENSGDFTLTSKYNNQHVVRFWECLYFIIITLSTVGYGDICPATLVGRVFVTLFILIALAVFASFLPELSEFIFSRSSYSGSYHKESGRKHVIVCGNINFDSVTTFLADFFHEDRSNTNVEVVFLNKDQPQEDLKGLLKSYLQVKYFEGTVMNHSDLDRVQMSCADACLILANQNCLHPNDEDAGNTMRAISVKNYSQTCPVIIQLLQFENKIYLENIPAWNRRNGDHIICYSEIELGILAQSCLVPGFSTLLTNLFAVRGIEGCHHLAKNNSWLKNYMNGTTLEIYSATFSHSFTNMNYKDLVGFCQKKFNLLLIAIEVTDREKKRTLLINPLNCKKIYSNTVGYFVCDSYKDAENVTLYCMKCHSGLKDLTSLKICRCKDIENGEMAKIIYREAMSETDIDDCPKGKQCTTDLRPFHMSHFQNLSDCVIENENQAAQLNDHIILCIFSEKESPLIGIRNFLIPLRNLTIHETELKDVLIVADKNFIEKEWLEISCFPRIRIAYHSFSIRRMADLLAIERCARCVILNAKSNFRELQHDLYMVDKEIIIANLYFQATFRQNIKRRTRTPNFRESDKNTIIRIDVNEPGEKDSPGPKESQFTIPIISKLAVESNVQFLDVKENNSKKIPNYLRKPFAFGYVFTANMLDSLLSTAYFSPNAISIMEILISGGVNCEVESENYDVKDDMGEKPLNRIRIELVSVSEFSSLESYNDLFIDALKTHDTLCLGLYRKRHLKVDLESVVKIDRYVITNPPGHFLLDSSDLVYCLKQVN